MNRSTGAFTRTRFTTFGIRIKWEGAGTEMITLRSSGAVSHFTTSGNGEPWCSTPGR